MAAALKAFGMTDVGRERDHNEDSFGVFPQYKLFVVADGMGGHRAGDVASQLSVKAIEEFFDLTEKDDITWPFQFDPNSPFSLNRLLTAVQVGNHQIFQKACADPDAYQGMGTTVVGLMGVDNNTAMHVIHVGDSRCYRIRGDQITGITMDHSLINDYLRAVPDLTDEQLAELPSNVITRALGMQEKVLVDHQTIEVQVGDIMLLCSDGLNGMIKDDEICRIVDTNRGDLEATAKALIEGANAAGGDDNITVLLVEVIEVDE